MLTNKSSSHVFPWSVSISLFFRIDLIEFGRLDSRKMKDFLFESAIFSVWRSLEKNSVSAENSNAEPFKVFGVCSHWVNL